MKLLRQKRGVSQKVIADFMGISVAAYSKIESGITDVNVSRLFQLAELYEISPASMIGGDDLQVDIENEVRELKEKLRESDERLLEWQAKLISCYEQINNSMLDADEIG